MDQLKAMKADTLLRLHEVTTLEDRPLEVQGVRARFTKALDANVWPHLGSLSRLLGDDISARVFRAEHRPIPANSYAAFVDGHLTTEQVTALLNTLDDVCQRAQELSKALRAAMSDRARRDRQLLSSRAPERRRVPRKANLVA